VIDFWGKGGEEGGERLCCERDGWDIRSRGGEYIVLRADWCYKGPHKPVQIRKSESYIFPPRERSFLKSWGRRPGYSSSQEKVLIERGGKGPDKSYRKNF